MIAKSEAEAPEPTVLVDHPSDHVVLNDLVEELSEQRGRHAVDRVKANQHANGVGAHGFGPLFHDCANRFSDKITTCDGR